MTRKLSLIILLAVNIPLALMLIITAYGGVISPSVSVTPAILSMTFPAFLILTILFLIINLFINRPCALINAISLLICGGPALTYCPLNIFRVLDRPSESAETFTLMNYNVMNLTDYSLECKGETNVNTGATLRFILEKRPDIAALQECTCAQLEDTGKLYPTLLDSLYSEYPYTDCTVAEGLILLSRYPVKPLDIEFPEMTSFSAKAYEIDIEGHLTYLINVHLQSIGLTSDDKKLYLELTKGDARTKQDLKEVRNDLLWKLGEAFRQRAIQAQAIRDIVSDMKGNVIICGDFNDIPDSYSVRTICGDDLQSAYSLVGIGPGISYHANRFFFRIDHCLYRGDMVAVRSDVIHCNASDHYPVLTTFEWQNQ